MTVEASQAPKARILVLHSPDAPELEVLKKLPEDAKIVGVGRTYEDLSCKTFALFCMHPTYRQSLYTSGPLSVDDQLLSNAALSESDWQSVNVLLNCGAPVKRNLQTLWPHLPNLEWLHSTAAGVEHILFPDLVEGPVTLTNAKV